MKTQTKHICKKSISLLLTFMLVFATMLIGVTSTSAADVDVAAVGGDTIKIYFTNNKGWDKVQIYYWGGASGANGWPGTAMTYVRDNSSGQAIYSCDIPSDATSIIFNCRDDDAGVTGNAAQTVDITTNVTNGKGFYLTNQVTTEGGNKDKWNVGTYDYTDIGEPETTAPTNPVSGETKTVYIAIFRDFIDQHFMPTLHWWNNTLGLTGDVDLTDTGVDADFVVGEEYWQGKPCQFHIYTAQVPVEAKSVKTYKADTNQCWAEETFTIADGKIALCFEYGGRYHNLTTDYSGSESTTIGDIWVDTNVNFGDEDEETDDIDLLIAEKSGSTYTLYLPSGVDRSAVPFYHKFENLTINGTAVTSGDTVSLTNGSYEIGGDTTGTLRVYQSQGVATLYTYTSKSMPTTVNANGCSSKDGYSTSGTYMKADANGNIELDEANLKKVKGRGNSSWKASYERFGKYSYNVTLESKAKLIAGGDKCKKYSVLANNADESRMRNMVVYQLSNAIGINYTTKFEQVDMYNNHRYMGSYMICYKVEIGNPLVDIYDLEAANEELTDNAFVYEDGTYTQGYVGGTGVNDNSTPNFYKYISKMKTPDYYQGGYLLEFELNERFADELCGFISAQGQQIVCKYPEFCSNTEVKYIRDVWNAAEEVMYNKNATYEQLNAVIDVESFAKMYLIQELTKNLDGCATSYYVYLDKGGKLTAGCTWDYDWTLGQYGSDNQKAIVTSNKATWLDVCNGNVNDPEGWFEAVKAIYGTSNKLNAQAALCQNSAFWNVVKTEWNELFYDTAAAYCTNGTVSSASNLSGEIGGFYNQIRSSIAMDETRWGFIASDPISDWGSANTGANFDAATVALNNWYYTRLDWMNNRLNSSTYTLAKPTLEASVSECMVGDTVTLVAKCNSAGNITYTIYDGNDQVVGTVESNNGTAEYTFTAMTPGTSQYYVKAATNNTVNESAASEKVDVVIRQFELVASLAAKNANVEAGYAITLTATSNAIDSATYTLYDADTNTVVAKNSTGKFTVATAEDDVNTTKSYYVEVKTTYSGNAHTATTSTVAINIIPVQAQYTVNVYFKSTGTYGYAPHITTTGCVSDFNDADMDRDLLIGKNSTQTASYYWYKTTVDVSKAHTTISLRFSSSRYVMDGTITLKIDHSGDYYFGMDRLNNGTVVFNLTDRPAAERNWYQSAAHMVYDAKYDGVLPVSADVELVRVGDANGDGKVNIKDATFIQKAVAGIVTLDSVGNAVADVDCDGTITIKDATLLQKQIAAVL